MEKLDRRNFLRLMGALGGVALFEGANQMRTVVAQGWRPPRITSDQDINVTPQPKSRNSRLVCNQVDQVVTNSTVAIPELTVLTNNDSSVTIQTVIDRRIPVTELDMYGNVVQQWDTSYLQTTYKCR